MAWDPFADMPGLPASPTIKSLFYDASFPRSKFGNKPVMPIKFQPSRSYRDLQRTLAKADKELTRDWRRRQVKVIKPILVPAARTFLRWEMRRTLRRATPRERAHLLRNRHGYTAASIKVRQGRGKRANTSVVFSAGEFPGWLARFLEYGFKGHNQKRGGRPYAFMRRAIWRGIPAIDRAVNAEAQAFGDYLAAGKPIRFKGITKRFRRG